MGRWLDFTAQSSMHGVKNIHDNESSKYRRLIWFVLTLGFTGYSLFSAVQFLIKYNHKLLDTKISVETLDSITFPTVTICNQNLITTSVVDYQTQVYGSDALREVFKDLYGSGTLSPPTNKYTPDNPNYAWLFDASPETSATFLKQAAHEMYYSILSCNIGGIEENCTDVFITVPTDAGYCFQFNSNGTYNASVAGKAGGITLTLNAAVGLYSYGPASESEGFSLTFTEKDEVPLVRELSIAVSPGTEANIALHKSETHRYPPPANKNRSKCFDTTRKPNPLLFYRTYSRSACRAECKASYVINKCGCRDPTQPALNSTKMCTIIEMLYCSQPAINSFAGDPYGMKACQCPDPCIDSEYTATVSAFKFPNINTLTMKSTDVDAEYIKNNLLKVNIYFGKLHYTLLQEELTYGAIDALANIGGTLGLFIGASMLTVCEFLEFGIISLVSCLCKEKKKSNIIKVEPVSSETQ